jgi:hypothetical protein
MRKMKKKTWGLGVMTGRDGGGGRVRAVDESGVCDFPLFLRYVVKEEEA